MTRCGADAGIARRLLVLADREEIAAEDRAVQHHAHDERDDDEGDAGCAGCRRCGRRSAIRASGSSAPKAKPAVASSV